MPHELRYKSKNPALGSALNGMIFQAAQFRRLSEAPQFVEFGYRARICHFVSWTLSTALNGEETFGHNGMPRYDRRAIGGN